MNESQDDYSVSKFILFGIKIIAYILEHIITVTATLEPICRSRRNEI